MYSKELYNTIKDVQNFLKRWSFILQVSNKEPESTTEPNPTPETKVVAVVDDDDDECSCCATSVAGILCIVFLPFVLIYFCYEFCIAIINDEDDS